MNVLVDTSVWSLALRRKNPAPDTVVRELAELIGEGRVVLIGPIRQELLSGIKAAAQFESLRDRLSAWTDLELETADFEEAARISNRCRSKGIQGSNTDFLMCAIAERHHLAIFTTDADFSAYRRAVSFSLHAPRQ